MTDWAEELSGTAPSLEAAESLPTGRPREEVASPILPQEITEDAIARLFTERHGQEMRFDHDAGQWFEWTGDRWQPDGTGRAYDFCRTLAREASRGRHGRDLATARLASFASGVERMARVDRTHAVTQEIWDRDPMLLGVPGGTVDLRTGVMRPADPADGITKLAGVAPLATEECPLWKSFLDEVLGGDPDLIRFLQHWCGYCLTGETSEHALVFIHGPGGNGKSVFLNVLAGILGDYATVASMDTFTASRADRHPTDLAMLRGARVVTASETEVGRSWAEARIKQITGGDPISARFMRQDFFTYKPNFKLTIVGNHRPALVNVDDAVRRRFRIVPFTRRPSNPDPQLEKKIRAEWPGILRWMINGALDWQKHGLSTPRSVAEATEEYFEEQDVFGQWVADCCFVRPGNHGIFASSAQLYASWREYACKAGEDPGTAKAFGEQLRRRGFSRTDKKLQGKTRKVWAGIRLEARGPQHA